MSTPLSASASDEPAASAWLIALLLAVTGFGLIAMTICLPSMTSWAAEFGATQGSVQLTFSSFVIGLGGAQVIYGPLSDRHGRRRLLMAGFALAVAGSLGGALAATLPQLITARFVQGAGAAAGMVIGRAMVQDYFSGADRPRIMAYIGMVLGVCPPLATVLGGQLHVYLGWRANFFFAALSAALLLVAIAVLLPRDQPAAGARDHWLREFVSAYARLARLPAYLAYCVILSMCTGAFYVFLAGVPVVLTNYGVGPAAIGWYIIFPPLCYIVGNFLTSRLLRHTSEIRLMFLGHATTLTGIATSLVLAWLGVRSPFAVVAPLAMLGLGHGLLMPSTLAGTVSLVPALAGAAAAGAGLAQQFFGGFGAYVVGLFSHHDASSMAGLMLLFMSISLTAQTVLMRVYRGPPHGG